MPSDCVAARGQLGAGAGGVRALHAQHPSKPFSLGCAMGSPVYAWVYGPFCTTGLFGHKTRFAFRVV